MVFLMITSQTSKTKALKYEVNRKRNIMFFSTASEAPSDDNIALADGSTYPRVA